MFQASVHALPNFLPGSNFPRPITSKPLTCYFDDCPCVDCQDDSNPTHLRKLAPAPESRKPLAKGKKCGLSSQANTHSATAQRLGMWHGARNPCSGTERSHSGISRKFESGPFRNPLAGRLKQTITHLLKLSCSLIHFGNRKIRKLP